MEIFKRLMVMWHRGFMVTLFGVLIVSVGMANTMTAQPQTGQIRVNITEFNGLDRMDEMVGMTMFAAEVDFRKRVVTSVKWQMRNYPESRLIDLYKNFFQDKFGPGHMIADTASAGAYLRKELASVTGMSQKEYVETIGWEGNFVRVDLAAIKDELIDYDLFFNAFIKSMTQTKVPSVDEWKKEWKEIEDVIRQLYPQIPKFTEDSKALEELLSQGYFVVHHSDEYNKKYNPHYRLISKKIYETMLAPELAKKRNKGK